MKSQGLSGTVLVPMCYAGSIGPDAVKDERFSETFPATAAHGQNRILREGTGQDA